MRRSFLALACLVGIDAVLAGQADQPTFRAVSEVVQLDVSVLDSQGIPIRGLAESDFTIFEDDDSRPIVAFAPIELPQPNRLAAASVRSIAPDVTTNRRDAQRVIGIVIDDLQLPADASVVRSTKRIVTEILDQMTPLDLIAITYSFKPNLGEEFTTDRVRLLRAIDRFEPAGQTFRTSTFAASERGGSAPVAPDPRAGRSGMCPGDDCLLNVLTNTADVLRELPDRRKTIVLISPAVHGATIASIGNSAALSDLQRLLVTMQESNISVYQFDPRGLQTSPGVYSDQFAVFAENTGGRAIANTNEPWALVPQVLRETGSYYLVGFRPAPVTSARPQSRRIRVRVARAGATVRARSAYYPSLPSDSTTLRPSSSGVERLIARGLPAGSLPLEVAVAPFAQSRVQSRLSIVTGFDVGGGDPPILQAEVLTAAFRDGLKPAGSFKQLIDLSEMAGRRQHVDIASTLDLAPGRYDLRVAVLDAASGRGGSVYTAVTIPDFSKELLSLSGVAVTNRSHRDLVVSNPSARDLPVEATTKRHFSKGEAASAFMRIYQGGRRALPVQVTTTILNGDDRVVFDRSESIAADAFAAGRSADHVCEIPIAALEPGEYVMTIVTSVPRRSVTRHVTFTIASLK